MTYRGYVRNGTVLLEEPVDLPEGTEVLVEPVAADAGEKARTLIEEWLGDESGYDEESWPELRVGLDRNRLSSRRLFDD